MISDDFSVSFFSIHIVCQHPKSARIDDLQQKLAAAFMMWVKSRQSKSVLNFFARILTWMQEYIAEQ